MPGTIGAAMPNARARSRNRRLQRAIRGEGRQHITALAEYPDCVGYVIVRNALGCLDAVKEFVQDDQVGIRRV